MQFKISPTSLRQFFVIHLSRKAEGNGPMTPWQPKCRNAFKVLTPSRRNAGQITDSSFNFSNWRLPVKYINSPDSAGEFFFAPDQGK